MRLHLAPLLAPPLAALAAASPAPDAMTLLDLAEAAMRDGLPSLAWDDATNALGSAGGDAAISDRAVFLAGSALERLAPPSERLAWLDSRPGQGAPAGSGAAPSPALSWLRARALSALGRHSEAASALAPLVSSGSDMPPGVEPGAVARDYAHALAAAGRTAEAAEALEGAAPSDPGSAIDLARLHGASGHPDRAAAILRAVADDEAVDPELRTLAALRLAVLPDSGVSPADALAAFDSAGADVEDSLSPDMRALSLATRAALVAKLFASPRGPDSESRREPAPPEAVDLARRSVETARSADVALHCRALLIRILAGAGGGESGGEVRDAALELVSVSPGNPVADAAIADAAAARLLFGDPETALALCELHAASFPASPSEAEVQTSRAEALSALGRVEESATAYRRAAESAAVRGGAAASAAALLQSARMNHEAGLDAMAMSTLDSLLAIDPPPDRPLLASAMLLSAELRAKSAPDEAAALLAEVAERFSDLPEASEALFRAAAIQSAEPDGEGAADAPAVARGGAPSPAEPVPDAAEEMFRRAAEGAATNASAFSALGEEAAAAVQAAAALALAQRQQRLGENEEALQSLLVASSTPDGGAAAEQAAALLPVAYMALGRAEEAVGAYQVFTNKYPHSPWMPDAEFWSAARAFDDADWPRAAARFSSFAERWPESPRAGYALRFAAVALFRAGRYEEAIAASDRFVSAFPAGPGVPEARFVAAEALARLLRFAEAQPVFHLVSSAPDAGRELAARAALRSADCAFAMAGENAGQYQAAFAQYRAVSRMPGAAEAGISIECAFKSARCAERGGDPEEAVRIFWREAMVPFERAPNAAEAVWYSRAVFAVSDILRAKGRGSEADGLLVRLAATSYPGADEAARRLSAAVSR